MGPFLVFPTGVGVFRSHRNYTPANVGTAALSALPPDPAVTVAPGQTAQPSRVLQKKALADCHSHAPIQLGALFKSIGLRAYAFTNTEFF